MKCHHIVDEKTGKRVYIPFCWGSVVHGSYFCTCYPAKEPSDDDLKGKRIRELEKENAKQRRIIEKLLAVALK
jgi:hypothetical protein